MIEITGDDTPRGQEAGHSFLLIRRHRYTLELAFYRCHSAASVALPDLVHLVCSRWRVEEDFQAAKSLTGLDQGQVTCWNSWMRWSLISLISAALLAVATACHHNDSTSGEPRTDSEPVIALTRPERVRLLRAFVMPKPVTTSEHVVLWSRWRRRHQHRAALCHRRSNEVTTAA